MLQLKCPSELPLSMLVPGRTCSEASSMDHLEVAGAGPTLGISRKAAAAFGATGKDGHLFLSLLGVCSQLEESSDDSSDARLVQDRLEDVHSCIVALDDALDAQQHTPDFAETRQCLKQLQSYVLQLIKQVADAAAADAQQCEAASTTSSMDDASGSCNSSMAACDAAWRVLCQDAADVLGLLSAQLSGSAAFSDSDSPRTVDSTPGGCSRLVARQSRLSYAQYWSKKIAL